MATLKDIAQKAGVNLSTVSRALKGSDEISKETRDRIIGIARELSYVSNKNEKEFSNTAVQTIGLICPEVKSNYYAQLVNTLEEKVKEAGYTLLIGLTNFRCEMETHFLNLFARKNIDGIVFITTHNEKVKEELKEFKTRCNIPLIQVSLEVNSEEYDCITIDNYAAVTLAVEHLIELGHKDICYIGEEFTKDRYRSFLDVMKKHNLKIDNDYLRVGEERFEEAGYKSMKEVLSLKKKLPTAVFAAYDDIAIGAMKAIFESGLRIPEDISVIGIDNINQTPYLYRALSTVSSPVNQMGNIAMRILLDKVWDGTNRVIQHIKIKPELIVRETTAKPRESAGDSRQKP